MSADRPTRDELASLYLDQLPYDPYPVQEDALLAWFSDAEGVLVCAPTGTGKTLIAEAALFEALHSGRRAYYTTPLIALTEQKFREMQQAAVRWGFEAEEVGLVTGNRRVNPDARILVVVAEILLNRLLHPAAFDFTDVSAVVMDEFHSFADPERGVVWELTLAMLPRHVRLLLLSATVGNAPEFVGWLRKAHGRKVQLVQSTDRRVPLYYEWVEDRLLNEQLEWMAEGDEDRRKTPALLFCFNREQCWTVAEQLKGRHLSDPARRKQLERELARHDWSKGAGPKLKQILMRGVGVHHAGLLPKYRRIVEDLFQRKLLSVAVCTETLAAGMNLPARSVVLTTLLKGPRGKKKLVDASTAHQIFGRAGRPQFDDCGYVYALAHEDDVKILRFKRQLDRIPEDTKDPALLAARKRMKKKMPTRRKTEQYWNEDQFEKLKAAAPRNLASRGLLPWRLLAYLLTISPEVDRLRELVSKRLMDGKRLETARRDLEGQLRMLAAGGFVTLEPPPPQPAQDAEAQPGQTSGSEPTDAEAESTVGTFGAILQTALDSADGHASRTDSAVPQSPKEASPPIDEYRAERAYPTPKTEWLLNFRSVHPLFGAFLLERLGAADRDERLQAFESVLEVPGSFARLVPVPPPDVLPPGPLATAQLDAELLQLGLATAEDLAPQRDERTDRFERPPLTLAHKLRMLFDWQYPGVRDLRTRPVWIAGELLRFNGDFNKLVTSRRLVKQEGIAFRHLLRLILLLGEFQQLEPPEADADEWRNDLADIAERLVTCCREVDPESTDKALELAHAADVVEGEAEAVASSEPALSESDPLDEFAAGLWD